MNRTTLSVFLCICIGAFVVAAAPQVFAFGYGYGSVATGGSTVYTVTNLNDTGAGSLRDGLSSSGRLIKFSVGGTIEIRSALVIPSNTTIDGTTAPNPKITVHGYNSSMSGKNNIIVKNMRFRMDSTGPDGKCSLQAADAAYNIMVDHCSIEWGRWDSMSLTDNDHDITVQYCIIGQAIDPQYFACLVDSCNRITFYRNLFCGSNSRHPKWKCNGQYINNVVYNWGSTSGMVGGHSSAVWKSDVMGNYFIKGPNSANDNWLSDCAATDQWYVSGNYKDMNKDGLLNGSAIASSEFTAKLVTVLSSKQHYPPNSPPVVTAATAVSGVGTYGCQPLDSYDTTYVNYVKSYGKSGKIGK